MKATLLLRKDHEKIHGLFEKYRKNKTNAQNGRRALFEEIRRELSFHSAVKTEFFYPELRKSSSTRGEELVQVALEEHKAIDAMIEEVVAAGGNDQQFDAKMTELMTLVESHMEEEEEDIFAEARKSFSEQKLEEMGLEMETHKTIMAQIAA